MNEKLEDFKLSFISYLESKDEKALIDILQNDSLSQLLIDNSMDFLTIICEKLSKVSTKNNEEEIYTKLINFICENGNPKEVLCILNLHVNCVKNDSKYLLILYAISLSLPKLEVFLDSTLIITRDVLMSAVKYFERLPVAHYSGLEGKELEVYIQASETQRFLRLSNFYLQFLESLKNNEDFIQDIRLKDEIIRNILILYDYSIVKLAFSSPGIVAEDCLKCSLRAFSLIEYLSVCMHRLILSFNSYNDAIILEIDITVDTDEKESLKKRIIPYTSTICLLYHIFVDNNLTKFPQIFSEFYKITFCIPFLTTALRSSLDSNILRICLQLLNELLLHVSDMDWNESLYPSFFYSLKVASISNVNREIRSCSFSSFCKVFSLLNIEGRFHLLKTMVKDNDHPGFRGQLILLLKKEVLNALSSKEDSARFFKGGTIYPVMCDIFVLPDAEKTDILNESEWILAAINLLYVVLKRDDHHLIGFDVLMDDIENDFLKPLIKATDVTLAHYKNDTRLLLDSDSSSVIEELSIDCSWMNKEQKIDFLNKAILTLDMVKFSVSQVTNSL